jgi:hypothetical protein
MPRSIILWFAIATAGLSSTGCATAANRSESLHLDEETCINRLYLLGIQNAIYNGELELASQKIHRAEDLAPSLQRILNWYRVAVDVVRREGEVTQVLNSALMGMADFEECGP